MNVTYEFWNENHPKYSAFLDAMKCISPEQLPFVTGEYFTEYPNYLFISLSGGNIIGYIRYCRQPIGPEAQCPILSYKGTTLYEAKINAFAVREDYRNQGIGKALQVIVLNHAKDTGCHQVSSHSSYGRDENFSLKLHLGFSAQPEIHGNDEKGCYFLMPLVHYNSIERIDWSTPNGTPVIV